MAPDSAVMSAEGEVPQSGLFKQLFAELPAHLRDSFTAEQRQALAEAARRCKWGQHPTDIRLSIPLFSRRYYLVILAGEERRSTARLREESKRFPLGKAGNLLFVGATVTLATVIGSLIWTLGFIWYLSG